MVSRNLCRLPRYTETVVSRVLQVWGRYLPSEPYRHRPHLGFPNGWECTKRADYLRSALSGVARGVYCHACGAHRGILGVMTLVHFPQAQDSHPTGHVPPVGAAVEAFFVHRDLAPNSRRAYRAALEPLVEAVGADQPLAALTPAAVAGVFTDRWGGAAAATWNTRRAAVRAFVSWYEERWPLGADPLASVGPRRQHTDHTRAVPYRDLDELLRRRSVPLREKTLWRMLYETAARASEVLALDVEDLDRPQRRARVVSKGGNTDMVYWATPTARLLARYLAGRGGGPLFLTTGRSRQPSSRRDVYAPTGQARLAYRTAAAAFGRHSGGWTLHQLRHSSLSHLAEGGASAVMLQAKSRHRDLRTLGVYTRPGPEAVARLTDDQFDRA